MSIFDRMGELAVLAADPILSASDRKNLDLEFNELRNLSNVLGQSKFNEVGMFRGRDEEYMSEDFEDLQLGSFVSPPVTSAGYVGETSGDGTDWTAQAPNGWNVQNDATHGTASSPPLHEFNGWTFWDPDSWDGTASQGRSAFTKGSGIIAVADSDEFSDNAGAAHATQKLQKFDSGLNTSEIDISGAEAGKLQLSFDSSWKPDGAQTGDVRIFFDGVESVPGAWQDFTNKPDETNQSYLESLNNPEGAKTLRVEWDYSGENSWWWAIDNIKVQEEENPNLQVFADNQYFDLENLEIPRFSSSDELNLRTLKSSTAASAELSSHVEKLAAQKALLGSNLTELEFSIDRLNSQVMAGQVSLDRMTDAEMAEDMVRLSRDKIVSEGSIALMTQARGINQNLMNILL